jgi:hypothetical protein
MPTYKVESFTDPELFRGRLHYVLACEQCGETLWVVLTPNGTAGMSAEEAKSLCPNAAEALTCHERACPALKG